MQMGSDGTVGTGAFGTSLATGAGSRLVTVDTTEPTVAVVVAPMLVSPCPTLARLPISPASPAFRVREWTRWTTGPELEAETCFAATAGCRASTFETGAWNGPARRAAGGVGEDG